jgi:hypothetical protein
MSNIILNTTLDQAKSLIIKQSVNPSESSFLFYFKIFSFVIIVIITFSFGLLPIFFAKYRQTTILNYANPFAGGIFIGIGLFHLLPDASFDFDQYYKSKEGSSSFFYGFPMSYFIAFLSYSLILYLEKVAFSTDEKKSGKDIKLGDKKEYKLDDEIIEPLLKKEENNKEIDEINEFQELHYNNKESENEKINSTIMSKMNKGKKIFQLYLIKILFKL